MPHVLHIALYLCQGAMFLKYQEATCYFYIKLKTVDWLFDMLFSVA